MNAAPHGLVRSAIAGAVAGAVGTLAMDIVWFARARKSGDRTGFVSWETSEGLDSWDGAPAPAIVGKKAIEAVTHRPLDPAWARPAANVMHWGTGVDWGVVGGVGATLAGVSNPLVGLPYGAGVWAMSYVTLAPLGVYRWPWQYEPRELWKDLSAHLVYGAVTATVWRVLAGRSR